MKKPIPRKRISKGRYEKRRPAKINVSMAYHPRQASPGLLDRTIRCRHCAATFIPDEADFYRAKHEREFHNDKD